MRKLLCVLIVCCLMFGTAYAAELNAPGTLPISSETIHFTIGVPNLATVEDWETNEQTLKLEKDLNVDLDFVLLPSDKNERIQKLELMFMAGGDDLPDIIMGDNGDLSNIIRYGEMGMILPTTEYYKNEAYWTTDTLTEGGMTLEDELRYVTCYDGEIYGVMQYNGSPNNCYSESRVMVYEPWLKQLGLEKPVTTDDFADMLRAFRDKDPNGNGEADEIPLMSYNDYIQRNFIRFLMSPFIYTQENYFNWNEGTIEFVANTPQWKEGIKWIHSLYEEGLILPMSFTQDRNSYTAILSEEPEKVGAFAMYSASNLGATDARRADYICLDPLLGPEGVRNGIYMPRIPAIRMMITKNCKEPEAAFRLGDYLCSQVMSLWTRYGEENVDWFPAAEDASGVYEDSFGYKAFFTVVTSWGVLQNKWWGVDTPCIILDKWSAGQAKNEADIYNHTFPIGRSMKKTVEYANKHPITGLVFTEEEQEVVTEYQATINDYVLQSFSEFVTGIKNVDTDWDAYVEEFNRMGLSEYMGAVQSCYDRMYK